MKKIDIAAIEAGAADDPAALCGRLLETIRIQHEHAASGSTRWMRSYARPSPAPKAREGQKCSRLGGSRARTARRCRSANGVEVAGLRALQNPFVEIAHPVRPLQPFG